MALNLGAIATMGICPGVNVFSSAYFGFRGFGVSVRVGSTGLAVEAKDGKKKKKEVPNRVIVFSVIFNNVTYQKAFYVSSKNLVFKVVAKLVSTFKSLSVKANVKTRKTKEFNFGKVRASLKKEV